MLTAFLAASLFASFGLLGECKDPEGFFYIYDWPEYIYDVWPPMNYTLHPNSSYSHKFRSNHGAGVVVDSSLGYFSTWQFAMFQLTMARLRASPFRTLDPALATSFIIPFDLGVHSYIDHLNGRQRVASPHGWRVIEWLKESIAKFGEGVVWKNRGHDHFVLFSITSYQIIGIGAKVFMTQICQNCSVLTIETTPTLTSRKYYANKSRKWWYAVPYPSSFHWHEGIKTLPWQQPRPLEASNRPYLSIFIGSVDTSTPRSNIIRRTVKKDCLKEPGVCLWFDTQHACSGVLNQTDGMLLYRKTTFCLTPTGDSLTRKSLFDSFLAGCIPVVFAKATITQYLWHIPPEVVDQVSVYIPAQPVIDGQVNFLDVLRNISRSQIAAMQKKIEELAPSLQYSVVPPGYGANEEEARRFYLLDRRGVTNFIGKGKGGGKREKRPAVNKVSNEGDEVSGFVYRGKTWSPPLRDAVDVIVERVLNRSTVQPMEGFTKDQAEHFAAMRDEISAEDPDYSGMDKIRQVLSGKERRKRDKIAGGEGHAGGGLPGGRRRKNGGG